MVWRTLNTINFKISFKKTLSNSLYTTYVDAIFRSTKMITQIWFLENKLYATKTPTKFHKIKTMIWFIENKIQRVIISNKRWIEFNRYLNCKIVYLSMPKRKIQMCINCALIFVYQQGNEIRLLSLLSCIGVNERKHTNLQGKHIFLTVNTHKYAQTHNTHPPHAGSKIVANIFIQISQRWHAFKPSGNLAVKY